VSVQSSDASEPNHSASGGADYVVEVEVDTEPPTEPTGLAASVKQKQINLSWIAAADNVGVLGYRIQRDGTVINEISGTSYVDRSLSTEMTYTYVVLAFDTAGNVSSPSNAVTVTFKSKGKGKPSK
jgi:chitodextrinase